MKTEASSITSDLDDGETLALKFLNLVFPDPGKNMGQHHQSTKYPLS